MGPLMMESANFLKFQGDTKAKIHAQPFSYLQNPPQRTDFICKTSICSTSTVTQFSCSRGRWERLQCVLQAAALIFSQQQCGSKNTRRGGLCI